MTFKLSLENVPSGAKYWYADYYNGQVYSVYMSVTDAWDCPYAANGARDLRIVVMDSSYKTLISWSGLGPIYDSKTYVFNCSASILSEIGPGGWVLLATNALYVKVSIIAGWVLLTTATSLLKVSVTAGWVLLATNALTLKLSAALGWVLLAEKNKIITVEGGELPPPPPPPPPEEEEIPWLPVALIGGGAIVAVAAAVAAAKGKPKKT